jgi:hypothetical protein
MTTEQQILPEMPPHKIAFIIDGIVQDVLHTEARLAALLLSEPIILDVTDYYVEKGPEFSVVNWAHNEADNTLSFISFNKPE